MAYSSHITNNSASEKVRTLHPDARLANRYHRPMARRGKPVSGVNWFIREWMDTLEVRQAEMCRRTGWSKATASQLYNEEQDYSPAIVNAAAVALNCRPWELLMRPSEAMAIRSMRDAAVRIAADNTAQPGRNPTRGNIDNAA